ncbi:hypothetical protein HWC34_gp46 [Microbacterium phage Alex44]|uniref:Minor tail protein gp31 C-terminal domain-containing protein n=4 Tax=Tinytimothyvirus alex44 TaxID=2845588 RepID=A0A4Y6EDK9_9CAUD|nr:hypothetical protein HWC34_gp46 [Microbacterium phage Alex44]AZV01807.1 hypothetical protein SEA_ARMAWEN_45 [Microbacterium phage ArMaWen]QDF16075.1 hypothetical protein SEA_LILYLOU_47 [Microbacterium phage LilyLou]QJD52843.1 hypothetical protein SEA_PHOGO_46 [Microbacterium phage Phogo]WNM73256.1 hypothetical protein SEA_DUMPQUIST_45 [Microbacterium phage DumpQuist]QDF15956.1 hypothetical protein SEA_ALEX44_46 [Microbacterium phage Alex44]
MAIQDVHVTDQTSGVAHVHIASISSEAAAAIGGGEGGGPSKVTALNGVTGLWKGTQAQYDALGSHDDNVVYVIKD